MPLRTSCSMGTARPSSDAGLFGTRSADLMRTAPKAGHMTAADQIVTASKKSLDPRAPSTHKHLGKLIDNECEASIWCRTSAPPKAKAGRLNCR